MLPCKLLFNNINPIANSCFVIVEDIFPNLFFGFKNSRYERNQDDSVLHVSHEAKYEVFYEPFYVSLDTTPPHDERFLGYGFTRNSQVIKGIILFKIRVMLENMI